MVQENFSGGGGLQERLQGFGTGEGVGVNQEEHIGLGDALLRGIGLNVMEEVGNAACQDETQVVGGGVREEAGYVFTQCFEVQRQAGGSTQSVAVGMGVTHHHGAAGLGQPLSQSLYVLFLDKNHVRSCFRTANLQKIIAFEK